MERSGFLPTYICEKPLRSISALHCTGILDFTFKRIDDLRYSGYFIRSEFFRSKNEFVRNA
ncbi:hypothetical protein QUF76_15380 [Desulfobacterales bacterium HSG16]|nr:hypothetical protein [Desulfobacterales bacterium HSG16]